MYSFIQVKVTLTKLWVGPYILVDFTISSNSGKSIILIRNVLFFSLHKRVRSETPILECFKLCNMTFRRHGITTGHGLWRTLLPLLSPPSSPASKCDLFLWFNIASRDKISILGKWNKQVGHAVEKLNYKCHQCFTLNTEGKRWYIFKLGKLEFVPSEEITH